MAACFDSDTCKDITERGDRLLEEVLEMLQAHGYDQSRVATLRDYVYSRPVGEPAQEVGGVMVTLAALCGAAGLDMHAAGEQELARIWTKMDLIRAKQLTKRGLHTPLPVAPSDAQEARAPIPPSAAFEIGYQWGRALQNGAVHDGRDVVRTLMMDVFDDLAVDVSGVDPLEPADTAICEVKRAIREALDADPISERPLGTSRPTMGRDTRTGRGAVRSEPKESRGRIL